jgi:hypothetical protein
MGLKSEICSDNPVYGLTWVCHSKRMENTVMHFVKPSACDAEEGESELQINIGTLPMGMKNYIDA